MKETLAEKRKGNMGRKDGRERGIVGDSIGANYILWLYNYVKMNPNAMYMYYELIKILPLHKKYLCDNIVT